MFKITNFSFGWNGDCNRFVEQLRGIERVRKRQRESERVTERYREKTSKTGGDNAIYDMGTALCA